MECLVDTPNTKLSLSNICGFWLVSLCGRFFFTPKKIFLLFSNEKDKHKRRDKNVGKKYLKSDGKLILEHGYNQKEECVNFFLKKGYNNIQSLLDLNNINRVTLGQNS